MEKNYTIFLLSSLYNLYDIVQIDVVLSRVRKQFPSGIEFFHPFPLFFKYFTYCDIFPIYHKIQAESNLVLIFATHLILVITISSHFCWPSGYIVCSVMKCRGGGRRKEIFYLLCITILRRFKFRILCKFIIMSFHGF